MSTPDSPFNDPPPVVGLKETRRVLLSEIRQAVAELHANAIKIRVAFGDELRDKNRLAAESL